MFVEQLIAMVIILKHRQWHPTQPEWSYFMYGFAISFNVHILIKAFFKYWGSTNDSIWIADECKDFRL